MPTLTFERDLFVWNVFIQQVVETRVGAKVWRIFTNCIKSWLLKGLSGMKQILRFLWLVIVADFCCFCGNNFYRHQKSRNCSAHDRIIKPGAIRFYESNQTVSYSTIKLDILLRLRSSTHSVGKQSSTRLQPPAVSVYIIKQIQWSASNPSNPHNKN